MTSPDHGQTRKPQGIRHRLTKYSNKPLLELHDRLNAIFIRRRDLGVDVSGIWRQLNIVERAMNTRRLVW